MPIPIDCPACSRSYQVREEFANRTIHCKSCGEAMTVPPAAPAPVQSRGGPGTDSADELQDDWAKAFGSGGTPRAKSGSRSGSNSSGSNSSGSNSSGRGRAGLNRAGAGRSGAGRRERVADRDPEENDDRPVVRRPLRGSSSRSPVVWVVVGLSMLAIVGALGLGVMFGIMRRQANTAPGPGGFPGGFPGNSSIPGVPPAPSIPRPDFTAPDFTPREFTPPDFAPPAMPPLPTIPPPPFPRREVPRPGTTGPGKPQPSTGPVGPNLKEDPNRPGGFPAAPGAPQ